MENVFEKLGTNGQENDNLPDFNHRITDNEILNTLSQEINKPVTETEIKILAKVKLPKSKAVGLDRIRNEIISSCLQNKQFLDIFKQLSNKIMDVSIRTILPIFPHPYLLPIFDTVFVLQLAYYSLTALSL